MTGEPLCRAWSEETLDYVLREMTPGRAASTRTPDADSEGDEGKFYVWTPDEMDALGGDGRVAIAHWGVTRRGTSRARTSSCGRHDPADLRAIKDGLLAARSERVRPALDDKRLTSWNALMISALADAGAALDRADYLRGGGDVRALRRA